MLKDLFYLISAKYRESWLFWYYNF